MNNNNEKWAFIVNPIAGNYASKKVVPRLEKELEKRNIEAEFAYTEFTGHAVDLSLKFYEEGYKHIIAVGGDGTCNEVSKSLVNKKDVIFGLVPCGTGNDFSSILGFSDRFADDDWDIFFEKNLKATDVGTCNGKSFVLGMGLGFDAEVASKNYVEPGKTKLGGKSKYYWNIIETIFFYKEKLMKIISQGNKTHVSFINTIGIGRRFGGAFYLTPEALADDGLFDICSIERLPVRKRLKILALVQKGEHLKRKCVNYYKTDYFKAEFKEKVPYHLDGELFFDKIIEIKMLAGAINVIYNPHGNHYYKNGTSK